MVQRIIELLSKELKNIHGAAIVLAVSALLSQSLALLRDRLLAHTFGAGSTLDVYYASFRIPDLIFVSVASFVSVTVLIPFLTKASESGRQETRELLSTIFTLFSGLIVLVCGIAFFLMPHIASRVAPGFSSDSLHTYILFSRILLLSPLLFGFSNLFGSVAQFERKFLVSAVAPLLYNLGIISGVLFIYPLLGPVGLVWGVVIGAFCHACIQLPVIIRGGFLPRLTMKPNWNLARAVTTLSLPRTLALGAQQLVTLVLVGFATSMQSGSVAVFSFASNMQAVPIAIVGVSYSTAAFPTLARLFQKGAYKEFTAYVADAARHIIFWALPITSLFIVLRAQVVRTILGSGRFDWADTRLTAALLALFCFSLLAQSLTLLFTRAYYAAGSTRKPLLMNIGSAIFSILLAVFFSRLFVLSEGFRSFLESMLRVEDVPGTLVLVLPFAFSLGATLNALMHFTLFSREFRGFTSAVLRTLVESLIASISIGLVAYYSLSVFVQVFDIRTFWGIFLQGFISGIFGIIVGIVVLRIFRNRELADITVTLKDRFWRSVPISPPPEEQVP